MTLTARMVIDRGWKSTRMPRFLKTASLLFAILGAVNLSAGLASQIISGLDEALRFYVPGALGVGAFFALITTVYLLGLTDLLREALP